MVERILIVGLGSIGTRHASVARQLLPNARIAAWRSSSNSDQPATIDAQFTTARDAMAFRPQVAVIASPASTHLDRAMPLAKAGVHLLVEKPIASSPRGVDQLIRTCRARKAVLMVGYNLRFLSSLQRFRQLVREGRVGRVLSVRVEVGQYLPAWRPAADYRTTVSASAKLGGGVLAEVSHEIDYLRWIFGQPTWVNATLLRQSDLKIDVEDTAHLVIGFSAAKGHKPAVAALNMDFVRRDSTRSCTVIGESGTMRWNALTGCVDVLDGTSSTWQVLHSQAPQRDESYLAEWQHLLACVQGKATPTVTGEDGLATLRVIEAARRSSKTGARVSLRPARGR